MMTQRRVETILRTWRAVRTIARARIERDGAFWASPIYPSVAAATPWIDAPAIVQQIKFEKTVRDGIEIITCENVMVEAWS